MSHQDHGRLHGTHAGSLNQVFRWLLANVSLRGLTFRRDCSWTPRALMCAGLLWAWSDEATLNERFRASRKIIRRWLGEQLELAGSYQAFVKLLRTWTAPLRECLQAVFRERMAADFAALWTIAGWIVFAIDGSRVDVPRTRGNEQRYSPKSKLSRTAQKRRYDRRRRRAQRRQAEQNARKANVPRIWLTVLWHVGLGLPWDCRTGPSDSSERAHLQAMLSTLPPNALLVADAGFVGYDLWQAIVGSGRHLLVRVGSNVRLLKKLGFRRREGAQTVYLWPDAVAKKGLAPLTLRLIVLKRKGRPMYLVTDLHDSRQLSDAQAAEIYRRRWGIELFYRHCKQTFDRGKLRSLNPDNALVELEWSLLGLWAMGLHSHFYLARRGVPPERISFAGVLRAYRRPMREYKSRPDPGERLTELLNLALIDPYVRKNKASRDYPRKKQERPPGPPIILRATRKQTKDAQEIKKDPTLRLTA